MTRWGWHSSGSGCLHTRHACVHALRGLAPAFACASHARSAHSHQARDAFLYLVQRHATVIVLGATGSGKTTQLPQFLAESGWASGGRAVACTQPRRVAAQTVALRVAEEMGCRLGADVGYSIRFEDVSTKARRAMRLAVVLCALQLTRVPQQGVTRIKYVTDGAPYPASACSPYSFPDIL